MAVPASGYDIATITNPGSALTDFTLMIDLSRMTTDFKTNWNSSDGGRGRASKNDGTTELACDFIDIDHTAKTGWLRVKWSGTLASTGTQKIRIFPPNTANTLYASADTYGSDNAYDAGWEGYYPVFGDTGTILTDRTSHGEDGSLDPGVTISGDKLVFGADTQGVNLMASKPLDGGTEFTIIIEANATNILSDRGLFYTDLHEGGEPLLFWMDTAAINTMASLVTGSGGTTGTTVSTEVLSSTDYHFAITWAGDDALRGYVDGSTAGGGYPNLGATGTLDNSGGSSYMLGNFPGLSKDFLGTMWGISIHSTARIGEWISEEYSQTDDNATFWGTWIWTAPSGGVINPVISSDGIHSIIFGGQILTGMLIMWNIMITISLCYLFHRINKKVTHDPYLIAAQKELDEYLGGE